MKILSTSHTCLREKETELLCALQLNGRGHGGPVVTHSPANSEVGGSNPGPYVGKLVVAYQWWAVYSSEP